MYPPIEANHSSITRPPDEPPPPITRSLPDWVANRVPITGPNGEPLAVTLAISPTLNLPLLPEAGASETNQIFPSQVDEIMQPKLAAAQQAFKTPPTGELTKGVDVIQTQEPPSENEVDVIFRVRSKPVGSNWPAWPKGIDPGNPDFNYDNVGNLWERDSSKRPVELPPIDEQGNYGTDGLPVDPDELVMLCRVRVSTDQDGNPVYEIIAAQLNKFVFPVGGKPESTDPSEQLPTDPTDLTPPIRPTPPRPESESAPQAAFNLLHKAHPEAGTITQESMDRFKRGTEITENHRITFADIQPRV